MTQSRIFLVDDDDDDIYLAQLTFTKHFPTWALTSFCDGQALIDHLGEHSSDALPNLIILDLNMPRLTGFETLTVLKAHPEWQHVPVAILTTSSTSDDREHSYALGACAFMTKPATVEQLASLIVEGKILCNPE